MIASVFKNAAFICIFVVVARNAVADEDRVRVGLIDSITGSQAPSQSLPQLRTRLDAVDANGSHQRHSIAILACDPEFVSVDSRSLQGACGRSIRLPKTWTIDENSQFFRGVAIGPDRPDFAERETLQFPKPAPVSSDFRHTDTPNDVVLLIDKDGWNIGFDWDCDLVINNDESFTIPTDQLGRPHLFQRSTPDKSVVLLQADDGQEHAQGKTQRIRLHAWTMTSSGQGGNNSLLHQLQNIQNADYELVLLDAGGGAADLAAAMSAAKKHDCDFVVVNLDTLFYPTTDAAQLVAELSNEIQMPALVNHRTTVSPNFVVHPSRRYIPDVAEFQFRNEPGFEIELNRTIQAALNDQTIFDEPVFDEKLADPETHFVDVSKELQFDSLIACGEKHCAARVPNDAIGAVHERRDHFLSRLRVLYDNRGRRISGRDRTKGIVFDWASPTEIALSRGGYVVMPRDAANSGDQIHWRRGDEPEITIQALSRASDSQHYRVRLNSRTELSDSLQMLQAMSLSRLPGFDEADVPSAAKAAAGHILNRPMVRSWWYLATGRHGSNGFHPLFQDIVDGQLPAWENSHLQYWTVSETGWVSESLGLSDVGTPTSQRSWILVQAAATKQSALLNAPKLVQSSPGRPRNQRLQPKWKRVSHAKRKLDPTDLKSQSVWIDEYENNFGWNLNGDEDVLWFALHQSDAPGGPPARFLSFKLPPHKKLSRFGNPTSSWISFYDDDATAEELRQRVQAGETPQSIVRHTVAPDANSDDLIQWRRHLLAIDQPSVRKQNLDRVASVAQRVLKFCEIRLGGLPDPQDPNQDAFDTTTQATPANSPINFKHHKQPNDSVAKRLYAWAADAAYRRVRAIGYRELPDVLAKTPIKDKAAQDLEFDNAMRQLCGLVPIKNWRFVLALVRYERRQSRPDKAYEVLSRYATEGPAMPWYFKKERDLWIDHGWEPLIRLGHARWFLRQANEPVTHGP